MKKIDSICIDSNVLRINNVSDIINNNENKNVFLNTGFNTGYSNIDYYLGGLELGNNVVIGARPSVGKTAFALELCQRLFIHNKNKNVVVLFFNWEMSNEQLYYRIMCSKLKTNILDLKKNINIYKTNEQFKKAQNEINQLNLFLIERYNYIDDLYIFIKNTKELLDQTEEMFYLVCVYDHTRLCMTKDKSNEEQKLFYLLQNLNKIKKLNILNIILSQLNRTYESGLSEKKYSDPSNVHLFGADAIQQFSDVTLLLHDPFNFGVEQYKCLNSKMEEKYINTVNKLFIHISKNRNGMSNFNLAIEYLKDTQTFNNVKEEYTTNLFENEI